MNISVILNNKWAIPAAVGVTGLAGGFAVGFMVGKKQATAKNYYTLTEAAQISNYELPLTNDINDNNEEVVTEIEVETVVEEVIEEEGEEFSVIVTEENYGRVNIFTDPNSEWNMDDELEQRSRHPNDPYIIHEDEYLENDNDWRQTTVTYYAGDDILADESDQPMYNYSSRLGELKFGHGTRDKDTVYIRNENERLEWEVIRSYKSFMEEIMGVDIEHGYAAEDLKHSKNQKFREI